MAVTNPNNNEKAGNKNVSQQGVSEALRDRVTKMLAELGSSIAEVRYVSAVKIEELKLLEQYRPTSEITSELSSTIRATAKFMERSAILVEPIVVSEDFFVIDGLKRVEVLRDLGMESVNAIVIGGLKCRDSQLNRLRCLGLRTALNTVRWDTISAADRRRIVFSIAREALKTLDKDETERIRASLAKHEVPRVLVDIVIKTTGISYGTVYRALQYIVTVPQLRSALLNFEEHVDVKDELFNLTESVIEKLRNAPEDVRNEIVRKYLEGEISKNEVVKVAEKLAPPKTVVEVKAGGVEETAVEEHVEEVKEKVTRAIDEMRMERFRERVEREIEGSVKELIAGIRSGEIDEDRIYVYALRREYPKEWLKTVYLVFDNAMRLFEDLIYLDRGYLYTLAQQIECINVVFSEKDVIPTWFRLMCGVAVVLVALPQFSNQRDLVKTICTEVNSELNRYERQKGMGSHL